MRMVSSTLPMSMIDVCLTVKRIECNSQKGALHKTCSQIFCVLLYYLVNYHRHRRLCSKNKNIFMTIYICFYMLFLSTKRKMYHLFIHLSCFKTHFHLLNVCCGKKCLNTCGSTCSAMIGREKRPEYVLRHQMLHSGRKQIVVPRIVVQFILSI